MYHCWTFLNLLDPKESRNCQEESLLSSSSPLLIAKRIMPSMQTTEPTFLILLIYALTGEVRFQLMSAWDYGKITWKNPGNNNIHATLTKTAVINMPQRKSLAMTLHWSWKLWNMLITGTSKCYFPTINQELAISWHDTKIDHSAKSSLNVKDLRSLVNVDDSPFPITNENEGYYSEYLNFLYVSF